MTVDTKPSAELISVKEAAQRLGVSLVSVYAWMNANPPEISYVDVAGVRCIPETEVERIKRKRNGK